MEATITLELTREESELVRKALGLFAKSQVIGHHEDGTVITKETPDGRDLWGEAFHLGCTIQNLWEDKDALAGDKTMIRNGDVIECYTILAVANGIALAHSQTAPDPYVVWHIDADGQGVYGGRYTADAEDAEWDFCAKAFPWFEDNVHINMIEDEDELKDPTGFIHSARKDVSDAAKIIDELINEMDDEKNASQEDTVEQIYGMLERINENSANRHSDREPVLENVFEHLFKIEDEMKKIGIPCAVIIDNGLGFDVIKYKK